MNVIGWMLAKLRQYEDVEVICAAAVFSHIFLFLKFVLCLLGEYFVSVLVKTTRIAYVIISKLERSRSIYLFLITLLGILLGRSLEKNLRSRVENIMAGTNGDEVTDFVGTADIGDVRTTYWVPEDNTMHQLDSEIRTETSNVAI